MIPGKNTDAHPFAFISELFSKKRFISLGVKKKKNVLSVKIGADDIHQTKYETGYRLFIAFNYIVYFNCHVYFLPERRDDLRKALSCTS